MRSLVRHIGSTWCKLMHSNPMWPINGKYQCRKCYRYRVITWEAQGSLGNSPNGSRTSSPDLGISGKELPRAGMVHQCKIRDFHALRHLFGPGAQERMVREVHVCRGAG